MKRNTIALLSLTLMANSALAQISPQRTALGTQKPMPPKTTPVSPKPEVKPSPPPKSRQEAPATLVLRAKGKHGSGPGDGIKDSVSEGRITYFRGSGPKAHKATFDMTLQRKGETQVQRTVKQTAGEVRQGSDGTRTWNSFGVATSPAAGASLHFVESQTTRSVQTLLDYERHGSALRDAGENIVELQDRANRKTRYSIDGATSAITRMEFDIGEARDMLSGKPIPVVEAYEFSDFRNVQGVLTPFKVERSIQGTKVEEMQFTTVRYNASLPDSAFRP